MTTTIPRGDAAPPELPRLLGEQGWTVLAWGADRHDTTEYAVTKQVDQGQDVVVVSVSKLDDETIALTSDGWRYPEEGGSFFVEIETTILGASDHESEETRLAVLRRSIERALFAALDEWPTAKARLKDIGAGTSTLPGRERSPSTRRSGGTELSNPTTEPSPYGSVVNIADSSQDEAVLRFRLMEVSAEANHALNLVDQRWVNGDFDSSAESGKSRRVVGWRFLEIFTVGFVAGAVLVLMGGLVAAGLLFQESTTTLLTAILGIVFLILLAIQLSVNLRRQNRLRSLANLAYLQAVEELRAGVQARQAKLAIGHAVEGHRSPVDTLLQGLWVPQSLLYDQAMAFAYKNGGKIMS